MKKLLLSLIVFATLHLSAQQTNMTISVGGESRDFIYYEPSIYQTAGEDVPVLLIFHGLGDNAANMTNVGFNVVADTANFIPVYFQGTLNILNQTAWNSGTALGSSSDDLAFVDQVLDSINTWYNIDQSKIWATGFSLGGNMSHHLACARDYITGIGTVGGPMSTSDIANCARTSLLNVMHMHGTADATVPYDGAALPTLSLVQETLDFYKNYMGCSDSTICRVANSVPADNILVDKIEYGQCSNNQRLEHWKLIGADHIWPFPPQNDIFATTVIWNFLNGFPQPYSCTSTLNIEDKESVSFLEIYPNPTTGTIAVQSAEEIKEIQILSLDGKIMFNQDNLKTKSLTQNISDFDSGVYYVKIVTDKGNQIKKIIKK